MSDDDKPPYDYSDPNDRPGGGGTPAAVQSAVPVVVPSVPVQTQSDPNAPYNYADPNDRPGSSSTSAATDPSTKTKTAPPGPSWTHAIWNSITGEDQPPIVLQPRSLSQAGSDVADFGRVFGNRAIVPNTLDRAISMFPGAGDIDYQKAQTAKAREDIGPVASGIADFMGQRASVARNAGPITQGVVTGGVGTVAGGDYNPLHIASNAAADIGFNKAGQMLGTFGAGAAKWADRTAREVGDEAFLAGQGAGARTLQGMHDLWQRGGDLAAQAEQYAGTAATGEAEDAYRKIAEAANQSIDPTAIQRGISGAVGTYVPAVGPLASAYILDPATRAINRVGRDINVRSAIDQAYPAVAGVVKSAVDPQTWRTAFGNLALSNAPDFNTLKSKIPTMSLSQPWTSWFQPKYSP